MLSVMVVRLGAVPTVRSCHHVRDHRLRGGSKTGRRLLTCEPELAGGVGHGAQLSFRRVVARRNQRAQRKQVAGRCERRRRAAAACALISPRRRDHPLAAIGQHDQQLHPATPPRPAQHLQALPLKDIPVTGHHHLGAAAHHAPRTIRSR